MISKKTFLKLLFLSVGALCDQELSGFFGFSSSGYNIGIGITLGEEAIFNVYYALHFKNAARYQASLGFSMAEVMNTDRFNASFYLKCRHSDGLNSLGDLSSLMAVNEASESSAANSAESCKGVTQSSAKPNNEPYFLLRSFFSLNKTIAFSINQRSSGWSFKTGAEQLTNFLKIPSNVQGASDSLEDLAKYYVKETLEGSKKSSLNSITALQKGDVSLDKDLFNKLLYNHGLHVHLLASLFFAWQKEVLQQQWINNIQSLRRAFNEVRAEK